VIDYRRRVRETRTGARNCRKIIAYTTPRARKVGTARTARNTSRYKSTVPANPFRAETVIVEVPATPTVVVTEVGLLETAKS